jgi:glycosyltransferase involved in cell wall biosynthesis
MLGEAIDSVARQLDGGLRDQVEICVSDNASTDGTEAVVDGYARRPGLAVVYHRNPRDLGAHANVLKVVELARGDHVWFLGSDDQLAPGAIARVASLLRDHPDLAGLSVNRANYDLAMRHPAPGDPAALLPDDPESAHVYDAAEEILGQCGLLHTYCSAQVADRRLWASTVQRVSPGTLARFRHYPHVYVIGTMVRAHPRWLWWPEPLVRNRVGNWSLDRDLRDPIAHSLATIEELSRLWTELTGARSAVRRRLIRKWYAYFRGVCSPYEVFQLRKAPGWDVGRSWRLARHLALVPGFWRDHAVVLLAPYPLLTALNRLRHRVADASPPRTGAGPGPPPAPGAP